MTLLVIVEAILYSPAAPHESALKLYSQLQQFAWTEGGVPAALQARGLPDNEPIFCFETALKASYFCMHTYRHFRVSPGREEEGLLEEPLSTDVCAPKPHRTPASCLPAHAPL